MSNWYERLIASGIQNKFSNEDTEFTSVMNLHYTIHLVLALSFLVLFLIADYWFATYCCAVLSAVLVIGLLLNHFNKIPVSVVFVSYSVMITCLVSLYYHGRNSGMDYLTLAILPYCFYYYRSLIGKIIYLIISITATLAVLYFTDNKPLVVLENEMNFFRIAMFVGSGILMCYYLFFFKLLKDSHRQRTASLIDSYKRKNEDLENFTYATSHDLREPIRTVSSFTSLIMRGIEKGDYSNFDKYAKFIKSGTEQMDNVLKSTYQYALTNYDNLELEEVDLNIVLEKVRLNLAYTIEQSNAVIKSSHLPTLNSNTSVWIQILQNTIQNSIKYAKKGQTPEINITFDKTKQQTLSVMDNGVGIDEKHHDVIFEMFKRLHNRKTHKGSGMGLAIVKKIVTDMNGNINVDKHYAEGTKIDINLPFDMVIEKK